MFQTGRIFDGGAVAIGFSTSRNGGHLDERLARVSNSRRSRGLLTGQATRSSPTTPRTAHGWWRRWASPRAPTTLRQPLDEWPDMGRAGGGRVRPYGRAGQGGSLATTARRARSAATATSRTSTSAPGQIRTTTSSDGGLTWSTPVISSPDPPQAFDYNGAQPSSRTGRSSSSTPRSPTLARAHEVRSRQRGRLDGGASFSAPVRVATLHRVHPGHSDVRARICGGGRCRAYLCRLGGCPGTGSCSASRIVMATSVDGVSWTPAQAITSGTAAVDHFLPGIGATGSDGLLSSTTRSPTTAPTYPAAPASTSTRRSRGTADAPGRGSNG